MSTFILLWWSVRLWLQFFGFDLSEVEGSTANRVAKHLLTLLFIGFQAAGTLGRRLVDGATHVRIFGEDVAVRARIATLGGFSAHADQAALLAWLGHLRTEPGQLFLVHGESEVATSLAARIEQRFHWHARLPLHGETVRL